MEFKFGNIEEVYALAYTYDKWDKNSSRALIEVGCLMARAGILVEMSKIRHKKGTIYLHITKAEAAKIKMVMADG